MTNRALLITASLALAACGRTAERTNTAASADTILLYSRAADTSPGQETANTGTLYTATANGTLRDIVLANGSVAISNGTDTGSSPGWAQPEVCWGTSGSGYNCEWLSALPTSECGVETVAANATFHLNSIDPGCTGIGVDDGMSGVTYPTIASGDQFYFDCTKWDAGLTMGAFTVSIVTGP